MNKIDIQALLHDGHQGNEKAFVLLFNYFKKMPIRMCNRYRHQIFYNDLRQEALLETFLAIKEYSVANEKSLKWWIYNHIKRKIYNECQRYRRQMRPLIIENTNKTSMSDAPDQIFDRKELKTQIEYILDQIGKDNEYIIKSIFDIEPLITESKMNISRYKYNKHLGRALTAFSAHQHILSEYI